MFFRLLTISAMLAAGLAAHADTVFSLQGTFSNGATLGGNITLNSGSTAFSAINATVTGGGGTSLQFTRILYQSPSSIGSPAQHNIYVLDSLQGNISPEYPSLDLLIDVPTLAGYNGSLLCTACAGNVATEVTYDGFNFNTTSFDLTSGSVVPQTISVTPEPSSILLLGTGLLGIAGVVHKRFA